MRQSLAKDCTQYNCCWNAAICSSFHGDQNGHFRMKFGYFHLVTMNSKRRVTFKVREVNYEHFLITIKLEFQKAISNRAWITNWQIVASWIRIFKCLYKIFPCRSFLEVSSCSSWSAYSTHLGFLARYRNLSWYFLYSESKYLTLMTTRKSNNRNYH